jgi:hypothetical protein
MNKKLIIIAAALLPFAACTKVTTGMEDTAEHEISFQVANYVQTKAPVAFANEDFGTYAWYNADDGSQQHVPFMVNEPVMFDEGNNMWTTSRRPYYWPKVGSLDFISYSPYCEASTTVVPDASGEGAGTTTTSYNPTVTENSIMWTDYRMDLSSPEDLMYSDKVTGQKENKSTYTSVSGVTGVPTLFHHALAKLNFQVQANFLKEGEGEDKTTWEVYLNQLRLEYIPNSGSLDLSLKEDNSSWNLPEVEGYHVWDYAKSTTDDLNLYQKSGTDAGLALTTEPQRVYTDENGEFVPLFVIPQILMSTDYESEDWTVGQQLVMDLTIVTHLPGNPDDSGKPLVITENIHKVYDLKDISPLKAWEMNQDITYTINIKPTASSDPGNPDDPKDVIITFDPAVDDWVPVSSPIEIAL